MLKKYFIYLPSIQGNVEDEWVQCLKQIEKNRMAGNRPLKLNIFTNLKNYSGYLKIKDKIVKSVIDSFGDYCPAINVSIHPPEKPWNVIVEAVFIISDSSEAVTKFWNSIPYVIINSASGKEIWGAGLGCGLYPDDTRKAAMAAFDQMVVILRNEEMSLNNIVRQWNYIGNILSVKDGFQNYQIFNEVRSDYYHKYRTVSGFPAATGVGMGLGGVMLDFCTVKADESVKIQPISNPNQVNAYEYGQQVLKGLANKGTSGKHPPQFERALLLTNKQVSVLHVSGTASIIGQETIGREDIEEQTLVTIENIKKLTDPERISQITETPVQYSGKYDLLRVYIKRQEDFGIVKAICNEHFPGVPIVYVEADICRDDLLTEMEAEYFLRS